MAERAASMEAQYHSEAGIQTARSNGQEVVHRVLEIVSGQERRDDMPYTRIDDPGLRASIKLGDRLMLAANQLGVSIPEGLRNSDWLNLRAQNVFGQFLDHEGRVVAKGLLKQARHAIRISSFNGDRDMMLKQVAGMMTSLRTTTAKSELPPLPAQVVASSS